MQGETWQTVLKQYPNLEFVVSDQASGLRKGVNDCGREVAHQYDVFHFKREIGRWLRGQEARCYEPRFQLRNRVSMGVSAETVMSFQAR